MLENGLAKPSCSPWSSPCLLFPKTGGRFTFCTDYSKVNAVTVPGSNPLPRMEDSIDNIGSACFVSKLDILKGCLLVPSPFRVVVDLIIHSFIFCHAYPTQGHRVPEAYPRKPRE